MLFCKKSFDLLSFFIDTYDGNVRTYLQNDQVQPSHLTHEKTATGV